MKRGLIFLGSLCLALGLSACQNAPIFEPQPGTETDSKAMVLHPISTEFDAEDVKNGTYAVHFTVDDFEKKGDEIYLSFTAYDMERFDAVDINGIKKGDTIFIDGKEVKVEKAEHTNDDISINGGLGESEDGYNFIPAEGGTYRVLLEDDYATYKKLGDASLPLSTKITLQDAQGLGSPDSDPKRCSGEGIFKYFDELKDYETEFGYLNTTITVKKGVITAIKRIWTP